MRGDILFVNRKSWIGRRISAVTKCPYSHVGLLIDDEHLIEATLTGIKLTPLVYYEKKRRQGKLDYTIGRVPKLNNRDREIVSSFVANQQNTKYDYIQFVVITLFYVLGIPRKFEPIDISTAWVCSELIAEAFDAIGVRFSRSVDPDNITPADIYYSGNVIGME